MKKMIIIILFVAELSSWATRSYMIHTAYIDSHVKLFIQLICIVLKRHIMTSKVIEIQRTFSHILKFVSELKKSLLSEPEMLSQHHSGNCGHCGV